MAVSITAIGTATPPYLQYQKTAATFVSEALQLSPIEARKLKSIYRATGIDYRYSVLADYCQSVGDFQFFPNDRSMPFPSTAERMAAYKTHALPLALKAIEQAFFYNKVNIPSITHVITVSCTGMYAPGLDIEIVAALSLPANTKRTAINFMGCYGAFNAIKVAEAICKANASAKVLVICIELCSLHFQKKIDLDNLIANAIFADGAAAVVIESTKDFTGGHFILEDFHCDMLPQNHADMAWKISDSGFDIVLSSYVPSAIQSGIKQFLDRLLATQQLTLADIDYYAIHPGGQKILEACESALGLTRDCNHYAYDILKNYGNMSSATILFVLKAIWDDIQSGKKPGRILSCAFGPGLTLESMLLSAC